MEEIKCPNCGKPFKIDEAGYAAIVRQVRDKEFSKEIESREKQFLAEKESALKVVQLEAENDYNEKLAKKDAEIEKLKSDIETAKSDKKFAIKDVEAEKDKKIADLENKLKSFDTEKKLEISNILSEKNLEISKLKNAKDLNAKQFELEIKSLEDKYKAEIQFKEEEIEKYKDFKTRLSTKMLGETLEQHCQNSFNQIRQTAFPNAYFEKDNDAKSGSKGDFIYRDYDGEGLEYISIMFEMKNEADTTATKKKNEVFFAELDKDRRQKNCEYAVLVSMLEAESDFYNSGIVDVSYRYEKMYVIRPQFFIPIITLLKNAAMNTIDAKRELERIKAQNIDIANFEIEMNIFKDKWLKNVKDAKNKFDTAITGIDKAIKNLQDIKEALLLSEKHLNSADSKVEDLTIKKLTKNSPILRAEFNTLGIEDNKRKK